MENIEMKNLPVLFFLVCTLITKAVAAPTIEEVIFFHSDLYGSPLAASNESGELLWKRNYLPYAENNSTTHLGIGYTGHYSDGSGLVYMGKRYYDPKIGRFLSLDPVSFKPEVPISFNRYSYAFNNPVRFNDPDGAWAEDLFFGIPSIVLGTIETFKAIKNGDWGSAGLYATGVAIDAYAIAVPGIPGGASMGIKASRAGSVTKSAIGYSDDAVRAALSNVGRIDHASAHLIDAGLITANAGSKAARQAFKEMAQSILTNPTKTFDHVMSRGGQSVKGFYGQVNGKNVVIFIAKETKGKVQAGDIVTAYTPSSQQMIGFGL
jgi:RHS repeat-associated protein